MRNNQKTFGQRVTVKFRIQAAFSIVFCMFSFQTWADINSYFGAGLGTVNGNDQRYVLMNLQAGYDVASFFAIEAHLGFSNENTNANVTSRIDYHNSIRLRVHTKGYNYRLYGYGGVTTINIHQTVEGFGGQNVKRAGYNFGIGVDLFGNESTAMFIDAGKLIGFDIDDTDISLNQILVGFRYFLNKAYRNQRLPGRLQF